MRRVLHEGQTPRPFQENSETKINFIKLRGFERFMNSSLIEKVTNGVFSIYGIVPPYVDFPVK